MANKNDLNLLLKARLYTTNITLDEMKKDILVIQEKLNQKNTNIKLKTKLDINISSINASIKELQSKASLKAIKIPVQIDVKGSAKAISDQLKSVKNVLDQWSNHQHKAQQKIQNNNNDSQLLPSTDAINSQSKKAEIALINSYTKLFKIVNDRRKQNGQSVLSFDDFKVFADKIARQDNIDGINKKVAQKNQELVIEKEITSEKLRQQSIVKNADYNKFNSIVKQKDIDSAKKLAKELDLVNGELGELNIKTDNERGFSLLTVTAKGTGDTLEQVSYKINHLNKDVTKVSDSMVKNHNRNLGVLEQLKIAMARFPVWMLATTAYYGTARGIQAMSAEIFKLDKSLTELKRVADSSLNIESLFRNTLQLSQDLGNSVHDVMSTVNEFARTFGEFNEQQLLAVARTATIASNVSELTTEEAGKNLVGTMNAFNIEAENSISIVDKMNEVDNNYAVSTAQLSDALSKSASVAKTYGVTLDENIGHVTSIASVTMESGAIIGNSLKSIYARISQLDESKKVFDNLGISMKNNDGTMKSSAKLIEDLAGKWKDLSAEEKRNIAFKVAGLHQISRFTALLNNYQMGVKATETALRSEGSASRENEKYLQSFEAKINKLKNTFTELASTIGEAFLSDAMMTLFGALGKLTEGVIFFTEKFGVLPSLFLALSPVIASFGGFSKLNQVISATELSLSNFGNTYKQLVAEGNTKANAFGQALGFQPTLSKVQGTGKQVVDPKLISELNALTQSATPAQQAVNGLAKGQTYLNHATEGAFVATKKMNVNTGVMETTFQTATVTTRTFSNALKSIGISLGWTAGFVLVGLAIEKLTSAYQKHKREQEAVEKQNKKMAESYNKFATDLDGMIKKYDDLSKIKGKLNNEQEKEYLDIINKLSTNFPQFLDYVDSNGKKHLKSAESMKLYVNILKEKLKLEAESNVKKREKSLKDSREDIEMKSHSEGYVDGTIAEYTKRLEDARKSIEKDGTFKFFGETLKANSKEGKETLKAWEDQLTVLKTNTVEAITAWKEDLSETISATLMADGKWFNLGSEGQLFINNLITAYSEKAEESMMQGKKVNWNEVEQDIRTQSNKIGRAMSEFITEETVGFSEERKSQFMSQLNSVITTLPKEFSSRLKKMDNSEIKTAFEDFFSVQNKLKFNKGSDVDATISELTKSIQQYVPNVDEAKQVLMAYANQTENVAIKQALANEGVEESTVVIDENTASLLNNVNAMNLLLGKTEDQIKELENAVSIVRTFGNETDLSKEQSEAYSQAITLLGDSFPYFSDSVLDSIEAISSSVNAMSMINSVASEVNQVLATSQDQQQIAIAKGLQKKIQYWNQEIEALNVLQQAYDDLARKVANSDVAMNRGIDSQLKKLQSQINSKKININVNESSILSGIKSMREYNDSISGKSGSGSSNKLADLFQVDTLERQHKIYESIIDSLNEKLQSLNKNSVDYRNTLKSVMDYELQNMAIEKQQIAQMEARNNAIQSRLGALGNTSKHSQAQRDEYNDLQKEYEDNLDKIASLNKNIQNVLSEIKEKSLEIFNDFIDEIVSNYETAVKTIQDSIDNTEFKIDVQGFINPDNLQELINLQIQKAVDAQKVQAGKQEEVNSLNTEYNNAVAQYGGGSDQAKRALEELNKAKEELEDAMIGVLQAEKDIQDTRSKVADDAIDALKDYYKNVEDMAIDALEKEKEQFEKLHDDKIKAYDDEIDAINKVYDAKFKRMDKEKSEDEYQAELNEKNAKKAELVNKITLLSKDNSKSGKKSLAEAQKELDALNKEIAKFQDDRQFELTKQGLEEQQQIQLDGIEEKKTAEDEALQSMIDNLDKQKEAISKHYEDLINNDAYWAKMRDEAIKGSFTTLNTELSNMKLNLDNMNLGIFNGLTDGIDGVTVKFFELSNTVQDEVRKINSLLVDNMAFNLQQPINDVIGMINSIGYAMTQAGISNASNANANSTTNETTYVPPSPVSTPVYQPQQVEQPTISYYPAPSYGGNSIVDALKSIGVPSDMNTRSKIASKNGISGYSGTTSQNLQLLSLLRQGRLARFKEGGYVGTWSGDFGKLAMVDSGEVILKERDTLNLFNTLDLMNRSILPVLKRLNLAGDFVNSGGASAITNTTNYNFNIEKIVGNEKGAIDFAKTFMNEMKKKGK